MDNKLKSKLDKTGDLWIYTEELGGIAFRIHHSISEIDIVMPISHQHDDCADTKFSISDIDSNRNDSLFLLTQMSFSYNEEDGVTEDLKLSESFVTFEGSKAHFDLPTKTGFYLTVEIDDPAISVSLKHNPLMPDLVKTVIVSSDTRNFLSGKSIIQSTGDFMTPNVENPDIKLAIQKDGRFVHRISTIEALQKCLDQRESSYQSEEPDAHIGMH